MKRPKKLKLPRKPKARASAETLKRYLQRVEDVKRQNAKRQKEYLHEKSERERLRKKVREVRL